MKTQLFKTEKQIKNTNCISVYDLANHTEHMKSGSCISKQKLTRSGRMTNVRDIIKHNNTGENCLSDENSDTFQIKYLRYF